MVISLAPFSGYCNEPKIVESYHISEQLLNELQLPDRIQIFHCVHSCMSIRVQLVITFIMIMMNCYHGPHGIFGSVMA